MTTRRRFLVGCLSAVAARGAAAGPATRTQPSVKSKPDVIVYDGRYPGWPWIAAASDGTFFCAFREGTVHGYSPTGKAMITDSDDGGHRWSPARVIVDQPKVDDRNVAVACLPSGDLLVSYNTYNAAKESLALTTRSSDGGRTWSNPQPVGVKNTRTRAAVKVLESGRLLLPYYVAPGNGALAALSDDGGRHWPTVRVPDAPGFVGDEWDAVEIEPDRLIGIFRNSHPKGDGTFWMSESRDGGQSWSRPEPTNLRDRRSRSPAQIVMHHGVPTVIYADRRMVSVSAARTTDPAFRHWDVDRRLPCYLYNPDQSPILDGSYPASVQIGRHRRLIVDYEIRPSSRRITGYFVDFPKDWGT